MGSLQPGPRLYRLGPAARVAAMDGAGPLLLDQFPIAAPMQRVKGRGELTLRSDAGRAAIVRLYQEGAAKLRLPNRHGAAAVEAVLINSAGGMTGGDHMDWRFEAGDGVAMVLTTQACDKVYKASAGSAEVRTHLHVGAKSRIDWLPQETIVFDHAALDRRLEADIAPGGKLLAVEAVLMGRRAMGETLTHASIRDRWRIRRDGRLIFADDVRLEGDIAQTAGRAAVLGGASAYASILLVSDEAEDLLDPLRAAVGGAGGASAFDGKLFCRIAATDGADLRRRLVAALGVLRGEAPLPRVWSL